MAKITFTIPDAKIQRIIDAMKGLYPVPVDEDGKALFTDNQWAKEAIKRIIVNQVARWENKVAIEAAKVEKDDTLLI